MGPSSDKEVNLTQPKVHLISLGDVINTLERPVSSARRHTTHGKRSPSVTKRPSSSSSVLLKTKETHSPIRELQIEEILSSPSHTSTKDPRKLPQNAVLYSFSQAEKLPVANLTSPKSSAFNSKSFSHPIGAQFAGHYTKLRHSLMGPRPSISPNILGQNFKSIHEERPKSQSMKQKEDRPIVEKSKPLELSSASETEKKTATKAAASTEVVRWIENFLLNLTDSDAYIDSCISSLKSILSLCESKGAECCRILYDRGAIKIITSLFTSFPNNLEINVYGIQILNAMMEHIDECRDKLQNKQGVLSIFKAAMTCAKALTNDQDVFEEESLNINTRRTSLAGKSRRRSTIKMGASRRRSSVLQNHKKSNFNAEGKNSIVEEEEENVKSVKIISTNNESIVDDLLADYYRPEFMETFHQMNRKGQSGAIMHMLSLFEKIDKLLQATHCTSLSLDLNGALIKILTDAEEMMQAELILLYEFDTLTNEIVLKEFNSHLSELEQDTLPRKVFPSNQGIAGYVITTGDIVNAKDPASFYGYNPVVDTGGHDIIPHHILAAPIRGLDGPIIAALQVVNRFGPDGSYTSFNENDEFLLKALGQTLGTVMTNAKAMERMAGMNKKVKVLLDTTRFLSSTLDFDTLVKLIMEAAKELLSADRCTLFLKDEARKQLVAKILVKDSVQEIRIKMDAGIAGSVLMSGKSVNIKDAYKDSRFNPEVDRQTGYVTKTILCMPIMNMKGECIGVTQMINKKKGIFTVDDENLLLSFSAQAAVAIEKTQLFKRTEDMRLYQHSILSSITSCVITLNESMRMVSMNRPWFMNTINTTEQTMMEDPINKWIGADNQSLLADIIQVYKKGSPIFMSEYELKGSKSSMFINYQVMPLVGEAKVASGVVIVLDDISSEKKAVMTLGRYMSPELAKQVLQEDGGQLGGKRKKVSILFSDIRSFTKLAESMEPHEVVELLNQHFTGAVNAIIDEHGILDKFIGDAVMAVFGVPFAAPEDPVNVCAAALKLQESVRILNEQREAAGLVGIKTGTGVNTGMVLSGNIGSTKRMEYSCIGDAVNLASRIEGLTKFYGVSILVTEFTLSETDDKFITREIDSVVVSGKSQPVRISELIGKKGDVLPDSMVKKIKLYAEGLAAYRKQNFEEAITKFQKGFSFYQDGPARTLLERCLTYLESPPSKDWNGVYIAEGK